MNACTEYTYRDVKLIKGNNNTNQNLKKETFHLDFTAPSDHIIHAFGDGVCHHY